MLFRSILFQHWPPHYPEIPTAVGFCMLITKKEKSKVGYFNEVQFGHGYGEENDYSLRVGKVGLKNILCDNAYVAHIGNESFADLGLKPSRQTMNKLLEIHPNYINKIENFIDQDPLSDIRIKIKDLLKKHDISLT